MQTCRESPFIHLFIQLIYWGPDYMPGSFLGSKNRAVNRTVSDVMELASKGSNKVM